MIGRRQLLGLLLGGLGTLASCRTAPRGSSAGNPAPDPFSALESPAWKRRFLADFRRNNSRAYSEEGVPVFLVGEDLAGSRTDAGTDAGTGAQDGTRPPVPRTPSADAARLAAEIRRGATVLAEAGLARTGDDLGKLVEVLAERDFGTLRNTPWP